MPTVIMPVYDPSRTIGPLLDGMAGASHDKQIIVADRDLVMKLGRVDPTRSKCDKV